MLHPVEYKCVVKLYDVEEADPTLAAAKKAGIVLATQYKEREQMAQVKGQLVAAGGNAFEDWQGKKPAPGDTVIIAKHSGLIYRDDEEEYRIINDKDIAAILE